MQELSVYLKTDSLVINSDGENSSLYTKSGEFFSGSLIRGIFADKYIKEKNLGNAAHQNDEFRDLFFNPDKLRFLPAMPFFKNKRAFHLPFSLQKPKEGSGKNDVNDLLKDDLNKGYKSWKGLGIFVEENKICAYRAKRKVRFHMSRSNPGERISGKSEDGNVFTYEALKPGLEFEAKLIGDKDALEKIITLFPSKKFKAHIGKSRFTEYGECSVKIGEIKECTLKIEDEITSDNTIYFLLETPLISYDECMRAENIINDEILSILSSKFQGISLGKIFASSVYIDGFVSVWGMRRKREFALSPGSVFELKRDRKWTKEELNELQNIILNGFGKRREEGFGSINIWTKNQVAIGELEDVKTEKITLSEEVKLRARIIYKDRLLNEYIHQAYKDAKRNRSKVSGGFYARLDELLTSLNGKKNIIEKYAELILSEKRVGSDFANNLKQIRTKNGYALEDVLTKNAPLPYENEITKNISENAKNFLIDIDWEKNKSDISDDIFYAYFNNYFRALFHKVNEREE